MLIVHQGGQQRIYHGISYQHASQWQRMAAMPKPEFEAAIGAADIVME